MRAALLAGGVIAATAYVALCVGIVHAMIDTVPDVNVRVTTAPTHDVEAHLTGIEVDVQDILDIIAEARGE